MAKVHGVTTTVMPRIPNYYTKHKGKWVTEYNPSLSGKLALNVSTVSFFSRIESAPKIYKEHWLLPNLHMPVWRASIN